MAYTCEFKLEAEVVAAVQPVVQLARCLHDAESVLRSRGLPAPQEPMSCMNFGRNDTDWR
eukprot:5258610-Pyramimonas_sp.AAC.1